MKLGLFILLTLTTSISFGQYTDKEWSEIMTNYSEQKLVLESSRLLEEGYYTQAEKIVDKLLTIQPENCNYNYRKGFILAEGRGKFSEAIPYLEKAVTNVDKNYDMFSGTEKAASIDSYFHLARCYHRDGKLDKAEEYYNKFIGTASKKTDFIERSTVGLEQLSVARKSLENPKKNVKIINLGEQVNTAFPDYSAVISFDGSSLYFTSRRPWEKGQNTEALDPRYDVYPEDVYVSYKNLDNSWTTPERLSFCNADQNEASVAVSPNERIIYVYQDLEGNGNMFYSDFKTNRLKDIREYTAANINTEYWETHCFVTPDGGNIYFTSDRPGGYGGRDIYRMVKMGDGKWSEPMNLGPKVNSVFDEDSPFMGQDNKTLYFASNGPRSMGGFDIFASVIDEDNNWTEAINMGSPFNSTDDDLFYTETIDGRKGYITSKRADSKGEKDIYEIQTDYLDPNRGNYLKGRVLTKDNRPLPEDLSVSVICTNCATESNITTYPRARDGAFSINLAPCSTYDLVFQHKDGGADIKHETVETSCDKRYEEIYKEVILDVDNMTIVTPPAADTDTNNVDTTDTNLIVFEPIQFKHNFGYNVAKLSTSEGDFASFLKAVDGQIKAGKGSVLIQVYASASQVPTKTFKTNQLLANSRAKNIKATLDTYFAQTNYKGKVTVTVVSAKVQGPNYQKDASDESKYIPYQYIELKTK